MEKTLDRKIERILADPGCEDFILADAKDADMGFGVAAPGVNTGDDAAGPPFRTMDQYRQAMREITRQGLVDIMLMSASTSEILTIQEKVFDDSPVTPAVRANDTTDIWLGQTGNYKNDPSMPFRSTTIGQIQGGCYPCSPDDRSRGADLGLYSITFNNNTLLDREALEHYRDFRLEAEENSFRHFLEVFAPNAPGDNTPDDVGRFVNDAICRTLAGVVSSSRPLFLKIPYFGPAAMEQLVAYDRAVIVGILGGFLMLGGQESFASGNYDRSPLEELLPVYINSTNKRGVSSRFRMQLTREGWLEPWIRVKPSELEENQRIEEMPAFRTVNLVKRDKPGAAVLVEVEDADGKLLPALVAREFGHGRTAAMLIGDFWRWGLAREDPDNEDMSKSWRQMLRWLVADVPHRVDIKVRTEQEKGANIQTLAVTVRDEEFQPLDNAVVQLAITPPDGSEVLLAAQASNQLAGTYEVDYVARQVGAYRVEARVTGPDGHTLKAGVAGWTSQPAAAEFQQLVPNRQLLESLAKETGGEIIQENKLENFARQLQQQDFEITEPLIFPLWHQTWIFLLAIGLLCAEWGLRRWRGLP